MRRVAYGTCLGLFVATVMVVAPALADGVTRDGKDADVLRLEELLDAQLTTIHSLQQTLVESESNDEEAARVAAMKQQIREVLSEQEFRESLMPTMMQAGYDKGFFLKSSDDNFLMRIGARLQVRWTHTDVQSRNRYLRPTLEKDDSTGFDFQRARLKFTGHVYTPDLTYNVTFRSEAPQGYDTRLRDAYINYRFCDEFQFQAGYFKMAATQQRITSDGLLQFPDRSMVNSVMEMNRGIGVRFWGQLLDKRVEYYVDVMNSTNGTGRTITNDPAELDNNPALAFRVVWHALGDNPGKDLKAEPDLEFHESPALDFAFHYVFDENDGDAGSIDLPFPLPRAQAGVGGFGLTNSQGMQIHQFGLASAFKYQGFSARGEYIFRILDVRRATERPFAPWWMLTRQADTTCMHGAYVQAGYFLPIPGLEKKLEAVARIGGVSTTANGTEAAWEYTGGLNYYLQGNNVKLQADITKITESPISSSSVGVSNVNDSPLIFRVQLQVEF